MWNVGDLNDGDDAELMLLCTVNTVGEVVNEASIMHCAQHDPITTNNAYAVTVTGTPRDPETSASIDLVAGYNLVSLPMIPIDPDLDTMMTGLDYIKISQYANDGDPLTDDWHSNTAGNPGISDLFLLEDGWGFWFNMNTAGTLTFDGYELAPPPPAMPKSYPVNQLYNLIGFKSMVSKLPSEYLAAVEGMYTIIYGYDGTWFIVGTPGHLTLDPGLGYWLAIKAGEETAYIFP
jgi:hypothetical protein